MSYESKSVAALNWMEKTTKKLILLKE